MESDWIKDHVVIVTGGGSGIGQAIAVEAAKRGAKVIIADINEKGAKSTLSLIAEFKGQAQFINTDVTDNIKVRDMVEQAQGWGVIKYLANSAGLQTYGTIDTTSEADWDRTMNVNLKSMFLVSRQVIPIIRNNGGGAVVNISSVQGLRCQQNVLAYATSKGAVIAMTRSMGLDHAKEGISINCICPGSVDTPLLRYGASQHGDTEAVLKEWGSHHPIGRIGTPEEIAKTTLFLWGPDSDFIVGQSIIADGGLISMVL